MIVMIEASTHTIAKLWGDARALARTGDEDERSYAAGMQDVLRTLGVAEPQPAPQEVEQ